MFLSGYVFAFVIGAAAASTKPPEQIGKSRVVVSNSLVMRSSPNILLGGKATSASVRPSMCSRSLIRGFGDG
jgi:hypothetical protein